MRHDVGAYLADTRNAAVLIRQFLQGREAERFIERAV
jgi:hypothetical protein